MNKLIISLALGCLCLTQPAFALNGQASLGACMVDELSGKEKKQLATWIFFAMAAHPEIKQFANIQGDAQRNIDKQVGSLVTRLLTESCANELKAAYREGGMTAIEQSFELVGKVAMEELMTNPKVNMAISGYADFIDDKKLEAVLSDAKEQ